MRIGYELAKQLKAAGFPQNTIFQICEHGSVPMGEHLYGERCPFVANPILSELIGACKGDETFPYVFLFGEKDEWYACVGSKNYFDDNYIDNSIEKLSEGKSPEEAAANLYLELNKNNA